MRTMYGPNVNGLCGNDDAGQMSAWYIFSALGFYPVTPGSPYYAVGSPLIKKAKVDLGNGYILHISTINQSETNTKVQSIRFNGKLVDGFLLNHLDLSKGGELVFEMM